MTHKWYQLRLIFLFRGLSFIRFLDDMVSFTRNVDGPFMMPICEKYSDMGAVVMGKVESGQCLKGQTLAIYPNRVRLRRLM